MPPPFTRHGTEGTMDNLLNITLIALSIVVFLLAGAVIWHQRCISKIRVALTETTKIIVEMSGAIRGMDGEVITYGEQLSALSSAVKQLQDHVGVITPEQLRRMATADRIREEYRSIGLAIDADALDEQQLRELQQTLLTLKTMPIRRETDDEVEGDLRRIIDHDHDSTGPLPHAADHTDETVFPLAPEPHDPALPWSGNGEADPFAPYYEG